MFNKLNASIVNGECVDDNIGSARVMEKAGLLLTKEWEEVNNETTKIEKRKQYSKTINEMGYRLCKSFITIIK
jgi:RimJ/RimL family protein N-acetyltransferase